MIGGLLSLVLAINVLGAALGAVLTMTIRRYARYRLAWAAIGTDMTMAVVFGGLGAWTPMLIHGVLIGVWLILLGMWRHRERSVADEAEDWLEARARHTRKQKEGTDG